MEALPRSYEDSWPSKVDSGNRRAMVTNAWNNLAFDGGVEIRENKVQQIWARVGDSTHSMRPCLQHSEYNVLPADEAEDEKRSHGEW